MNNEVLKAIADRRSIRAYTDRPVNDEELGALISAATQAPSAVNRQPYHFTFVRDKAVLDEFDDYMAQKAKRTAPSVAYFCMEYGLDTSLKIYSGGLGILAGDYLKETSDMNVNLVAVGLLYRYGYFTQVISG